MPDSSDGIIFAILIGKIDLSEIRLESRDLSKPPFQVRACLIKRFAATAVDDVVLSDDRAATRSWRVHGRGDDTERLEEEL